MSKTFSIREYVASKLMEAWFPKSHQNQEWLNSEDGRQWTEISLLDAQVAIDAYKEFEENNETK